MSIRLPFLSSIALSVLALSACTTAPATDQDKVNLQSDINATLVRLNQKDPTLQATLSQAYAYAIFPEVGSGAIVFGGSYGHGEVFQAGQLIGYADISQATFGAQIGGQSFAEILIFQNDAALQNFKKGDMQFSSAASSVAMKTGGASVSQSQIGVIAMVYPEGGLEVSAAIGGQTFSFVPK
jgi:lipid-binding SYLF domain-containing protein